MVGVVTPSETKFSPVDGDVLASVIVAAPEAGPVPCRFSALRLNAPLMLLVFVFARLLARTVVFTPTNVSVVSLALTGVALQFVPLAQRSVVLLVGVYV
jgi:hypothetical protein